MSNGFNLIPCPFCGHLFDLEQAWDDVDGRRFIELMTSLPGSVIRPFYSYLKLFKPEKQVLRWAKVLKLTQELAPLIKAAQIKRNGIVYSVPVVQWEQALSSLVLNRPQNLQLPLTKNAYLLTMLANQAEKVAAIQEQKNEQQKRNPIRTHQPSGFKPVGQVIAKDKPKTSKPPKDWRPQSLPKSKASKDEQTLFNDSLKQDKS